jgi:hypothetical protein
MDAVINRIEIGKHILGKQVSAPPPQRADERQASV